MITASGIRNAIYCVIAFGIVACASAQMPVANPGVAKTPVEPIAQSQAESAGSDAQSAQARLAKEPAESQRLAGQLEDLQAAQTARGMVLTLGDVSFDTGRAQLNSSGQRSLEQVAEFLNEHPVRRVQIEAFTDSQGTNDYNIEVSQSRADAVAMAIIKRGIDAERVRAMGYGEDFPVASNNNAGSRQLNRRVEIIVSNGGQAIPGRTAVGAR